MKCEWVLFDYVLVWVCVCVCVCMTGNRWHKQQFLQNESDAEAHFVRSKGTILFQTIRWKRKHRVSVSELVWINVVLRERERQLKVGRGRVRLKFLKGKPRFCKLSRTECEWSANVKMHTSCLRYLTMTAAKQTYTLSQFHQHLFVRHFAY